MTIDNGTFKAMLCKCRRENSDKIPCYYIDRHIVASFCVINKKFFYIFLILLSVSPLFAIFVYSKIQNI